jgi:hypothetical protein
MRTKIRWLIAVFAVVTLGVHLVAVAEDTEITEDNWTEAVGFKPDLSLLKVKKGKKITKKNVGEVADLVPSGMRILIEKYNLKLKIKDYEPIYPSEGYIEATNENRGKTKVIPTGKAFRKIGLKGYVSGLPFPQPKTGEEIAWNYHYNYLGDDADQYYSVYWVSAGAGVEHFEEWRWATIIRTMHRTDIDPIPAIKAFKDKDLESASITYALSPYDKRGFGALYFDSTEPIDIQGHIYIPAMRRVMRNTFGTRGDTWNATDLLYEDVRGYLGHPEWMNWKLVGKKTMLMPMHAGIKRGKDNKPDRIFEFKKWPHWNPKVPYEPRPLYVLEVIPKFPDYPYSKMIMLVDAETFLIPYKEAYDKKGELWKVLIIAYNGPIEDGAPPEFGVGLTVDLQSEHATLFNFTKVINNSDLSKNIFTVSNLRKRGK